MATAGRQTFALDAGPAGNLPPDRNYYLIVIGSGEGTVELGSVVSDGEDSGGADGWLVYKEDGYIEGDDPTDYYYPKVDIKGHPGAIPYLLEASIKSTPLNGHTYHAGEHIEVTLRTSVPVTSSDDAVRAPLWLGDGAENYRGARPGSDYFYAGGWRTFAVYKVHQDDVDTDGVILGDDLLCVDGIPLWKNALDATVPVSGSLDFATVDTGLGNPWTGPRHGTASRCTARSQTSFKIQLMLSACSVTMEILPIRTFATKPRNILSVV